jgi:hypothetical protein
MAIPGLVGGSSQPLLKYDAKARVFKVDDKTLTSLTAIFDIERSEVGWIKFADNTTPEFNLVPIDALGNGAAYPPMPDERDSRGRPAWRRGFRCRVKLSDKLAGSGPTLREWASCALATIRGFDQLHDQWLAGKQTGKVPVVSCNEFEEEPGQFGSNYRPVFKIEKWIPRPQDMLDAQPAPSPKTPPPTTADPGSAEDFSDELNDDIPW